MTKPRTPRRFSRRTMLRGAALGAGALTLPFARSLTGQATDGAPHKRFIAMFTPNGTIADAWTPAGTETSFTLGRILQPLEPFKSKLIVVDGLDMTVTRISPGSAHQQGAGCLLTGMPLNDGDFGGGGGASSGWASGISIDQHIANELALPTRFKSLELGVGVRGSNNRHRIAYAGNDMPLPPENSPTAVFDRLFGDFGADAAALERLRRRRQSVLDAVRGDVQELHGRLGYEQRIRMEAHLESLRDVERRLLEVSAGTGAYCEAPMIPSIDASSSANYPEIGRLQIDLLVMAFACDLTRISTLLWSGSTSGQTFPWLGITQGHHDISHEGDTNATAQRQLTDINRWYAEQLAYLLEKLDSIPEGDGTMLDNTIVFWGNELSKGNSHSRSNMKFVIAGSGGGYFRTGRFIRPGDVSHNDLLVSFANAMGVETTRFGHRDHCSGPLTSLT